MAVETATYIGQLNSAFPAGGEPIAQGDDHLRLIKTTLLNTFPGLNSVWTTVGDGRWVGKTGDQTMAGKLTAAGYLTSIAQGAEANALTRKDYVDTIGSQKVSKVGDTMSGSLTVANTAAVSPFIRVENGAFHFRRTDPGQRWAGMEWLDTDIRTAYISYDYQASSLLIQNERSPDVGAVFIGGRLNTPYVMLGSAQAAEGNAATRKDYVDAVTAGKVNRGGDTMSGNLNMNNYLMMNPNGTNSHAIYFEAQGRSATMYGNTVPNVRQELILTISPTNNTFAFHQDGNAYAVGGWLPGSDGRVKTEREVIGDALDKVKQITGMTYVRADQKDFDGNPSTIRHAGLIAQDVEKVLPEAIYANSPIDEGFKVAGDEGDFRSLSYDAVTALLVEAVKELSAKLDAAVAEIAALKAAK